MNTLTGFDYSNASVDKNAVDDLFQSVVGPPAEAASRLIIRSLSHHFEPGDDGIYQSKRLGPDGGIYLLPKIKTMADVTADTIDASIDYSKDNPRIVSRFAHIVRDLGLDELKQVLLVGSLLSAVGPRSGPPDYIDFAVEQAKKVDSGLANAWLEEIYLNAAMHHGLTGPSQLYLAYHNDRSPTTLSNAFRADHTYYSKEASEARDVKIILTTPSHLAGSSVWKRLYRQSSSSRSHSNPSMQVSLE